MTENASPGRFPATRWSLVAEATGEAPESRRALEELCRLYWFPIYSYVWRQGNSAADAEDLTQEFFADILSRDGLRTASAEKGKLRSFLLTALRRSLINRSRYDRAEKRGGGVARFVPIDLVLAEEWVSREAVTDESPEAAFDRNWANAVLAATHAKLRAQFDKRGKTRLFEMLSPHLTWGGDGPRYDEIAAELGMRAGTVRTAVVRLRTSFREALEAEIAETVTTPDEAEAEIAHLKKVLSSA